MRCCNLHCKIFYCSRTSCCCEDVFCKQLSVTTQSPGLLVHMHWCSLADAAQLGSTMPVETEMNGVTQAATASASDVYATLVFLNLQRPFSGCRLTSGFISKFRPGCLERGPANVWTGQRVRRPKPQPHAPPTLRALRPLPQGPLAAG